MTVCEDCGKNFIKLEAGNSCGRCKKLAAAGDDQVAVSLAKVSGDDWCYRKYEARYHYRALRSVSAAVSSSASWTESSAGPVMMMATVRTSRVSILPFSYK